jgi:hypothetical protein
MTTFLDSEEEAKAFAITVIKNLDEKIFEQEPKVKKVENGRYVYTGKVYPFKSKGKDAKLILIDMPEGWVIWTLISDKAQRY